jgi:hypothetical protein
MNKFYYVILCAILVDISLSSYILSSDLEFIDVSKYRNIAEPSYSIYNDVLSHSRELPFGNHNGRYTNVHETAHSIHNELRNTYKALLKNNKLNVIYLLDSQAAIVYDPNISIKMIQPYVNPSLRSTRYRLYLEKQTEFWNDYPTYILDEWNCYILGAECAIDDFLQNKPLEKTNAISGALEFSIYTLAMCLAIKDHDPLYWESHNQFKALVRYNLIRSDRVIRLGFDLPEFQYREQDRLRATLLKHEDSEPIRHLLKTEFDSILLD